ncbi:MAG: hypothetical protein JSU85_05690 [Candidatus Zixiibacteriota bacterium]|nr:MAG: hypothetical protein JSU85_05690 [candidate division Zixibacteria bacterium]
MNLKELKTIEWILKIISMVTGIYLIPTGFWGGVLGINPVGETEYIPLRIVLLLLMIAGVSYFVPNSKINTSNRLIFIYLIITVLPIPGIVITLIMASLSGYHHALGSEFIVVLICILLLSFAPLSLWISILRKRRKFCQ